jgi:hypothetical protein
MVQFQDFGQILNFVKTIMYMITYPTLSCLGEIGMTPARLVRPTVGLMPTTKFLLDGDKIEPSVSVPTATATIFAATDIADPLLEPKGSSIV